MIQAGPMSRSRSSPVACACDDAIVLIRPPTTGLASLARVQIAETPIAPAPMKRTCVRHTVSVCVAIATPSGTGCRCVRIGTAMAHAMTSPVNIARPTERPTRWPAPNSASDQAML